jgi:hypothetical protein
VRDDAGHHPQFSDQATAKALAGAGRSSSAVITRESG